MCRRSPIGSCLGPDRKLQAPPPSPGKPAFPPYRRVHALTPFVLTAPVSLKTGRRPDHGPGFDLHQHDSIWSPTRRQLIEQENALHALPGRDRSCVFFYSTQLPASCFTSSRSARLFAVRVYIRYAGHGPLTEIAAARRRYHSHYERLSLRELPAACLRVESYYGSAIISPTYRHGRKSRGKQGNLQWGTLMQIPLPIVCHVSKFQGSDYFRYIYNAEKCNAYASCSDGEWHVTIHQNTLFQVKRSFCSEMGLGLSQTPTLVASVPSPTFYPSSPPCLGTHPFVPQNFKQT